MRALLSSLLPLVLLSCGTVRERSFEISAIDDQMRPLTCLIVVDDDWPTEAEGAQFTAARVAVDFGQADSVIITVKHAKTDDTGKVLEVPKPADRSDYCVVSREIRATDPERLVFILTVDPSF